MTSLVEIQNQIFEGIREVEGKEPRHPTHEDESGSGEQFIGRLVGIAILHLQDKSWWYPPATTPATEKVATQPYYSPIHIDLILDWLEDQLNSEESYFRGQLEIAGLSFDALEYAREEIFSH